MSPFKVARTLFIQTFVNALRDFFVWFRFLWISRVFVTKRKDNHQHFLVMLRLVHTKMGIFVCGLGWANWGSQILAIIRSHCTEVPSVICLLVVYNSLIIVLLSGGEHSNHRSSKKKDKNNQPWTAKKTPKAFPCQPIKTEITKPTWWYLSVILEGISMEWNYNHINARNL